MSAKLVSIIMGFIVDTIKPNLHVEIGQEVVYLPPLLMSIATRISKCELILDVFTHINTYIDTSTF